VPWSKVRKRVNDLLSPAVTKRVVFGYTTYGASHDHEGGRGWIAIDGQEIINMWLNEWQLYGMNDTPAAYREMEAHNVFTKDDWFFVLTQYPHRSINDIMASSSPLTRAIGMLDGRVGKRRLRKLDPSQEHDLVKRLYQVRCHVESIPCKLPFSGAELTSKINTTYPPFQQYRPQQDKASITAAAKERLAQSKQTRKPRLLISAVFQNKLSTEDLDTDTAKAMAEAFQQSELPDMLYSALRFLEAHTKLLLDIRHVEGALELLSHPEEWHRSFDQWRIPSHNVDKQFSSLARHLFSNYDVPLFMDKAWFTQNKDHQAWFKHIGQGKNIRTAANLSIPLTKKMAHAFLLAPNDYSIEGAFRWGQVHALGGNQRLADALLGTKLAQDFQNNDFALSLLRFLVRHPMLDTRYIGPIIDYIWNQRYENRVVFAERGVAEEIGPAQPNFSMRGRTVAALLRQVQAWHGHLAREAKGKDLQWQRSPYQDLKFTAGTKQSKNMRIWTVQELLSSRELIAEGRQQSHCVASFATSCHQGKRSIWTMDLETDEGTEKHLTIELDMAKKTIVQVRGQYNRFPINKEMEILRRWASQNELKVAGYL
jgi:hypothetical protein